MAVSEQLAAQGHQLLWVARSEDEIATGLEQLNAAHPSAKVESLALDLTQDGAADRVLAWVDGLGQGAPDVLINNAGFASWAFHDEVPEERDLAMFQLNMVVPYQLTRRFLPEMKERDSGHIINMASTAGMLNAPGFVTYGATKAFLRFYSASLALELRSEGSAVRVTAINPAAVKDTAFQAEAGMEKTGVFDTFFATTPEEVAGDVVRVLGMPKPPLQMVTGRIMRAVNRFGGPIARRQAPVEMAKNLHRGAADFSG